MSDDEAKRERPEEDGQDTDVSPSDGDASGAEEGADTVPASGVEADEPDEAPAELDDEDSEPHPVAAPDTDPGSLPPSPPPSPRWMKPVQWLLPVVLAGAAVGVHWWLNVPEEIAEAPGDQGAAKKPKAKAKRSATKRSYEARDKRTLDREYKRWSRVDFEGEPVHGKWARAHQSAISRAVIVARQAAFEGAPSQPRVQVTDAECRTVRCRFLLRTSFEHELPVLDEALARLEDAKGKVWRTYASTPIEAPEGADEDAKEDQFYYQVEVTFVSDEVDSRSFVVPPAPDDGTPPAPKPAPDPDADDADHPERDPGNDDADEPEGNEDGADPDDEERAAEDDD